MAHYREGVLRNLAMKAEGMKLQRQASATSRLVSECHRMHALLPAMSVTIGEVPSTGEAHWSLSTKVSAKAALA